MIYKTKQLLKFKVKFFFYLFFTRVKRNCINSYNTFFSLVSSEIKIRILRRYKKMSDVYYNVYQTTIKYLCHKMPLNAAKLGKKHSSMHSQ